MQEVNSPSDILFKILRIALGTCSDTSLPAAVPWREVIDLSFDQGVAAMAVDGLQKIYEASGTHLQPALESLESPELEILKYDWFRAQLGCEDDNARVLAQSREALLRVRKAGFKCCILKGSGLGQLYDRPEHRATGDIDLWLDGARRKVFDFARTMEPDGRLHGVNYHHVHFNLFADTLVEGHIYPSWFSNPFLNARWRKFCDAHIPDDTRDTPSAEFNRVFVLLHIFHHYGGHGINLKQMLDYFHVLRQGFTPQEREDTVRTLKRLRLDRFAAAMMWFQHECLGLPTDYLLMESDEKLGRLLLSALLQPTTPVERTAFHRFLGNLSRMFRLARNYPHDALWETPFSIILYFWRLGYGYLEK